MGHPDHYHGDSELIVRRNSHRQATSSYNLNSGSGSMAEHERPYGRGYGGVAESDSWPHTVQQLPNSQNGLEADYKHQFPTSQAAYGHQGHTPHEAAFRVRASSFHADRQPDVRKSYGCQDSSPYLFHGAQQMAPVSCPFPPSRNQSLNCPVHNGASRQTSCPIYYVYREPYQALPRAQTYQVCPNFACPACSHLACGHKSPYACSYARARGSQCVCQPCPIHNNIAGGHMNYSMAPCLVHHAPGWHGFSPHYPCPVHGGHHQQRLYSLQSNGTFVVGCPVHSKTRLHYACPVHQADRMHLQCKTFLAAQSRCSCYPGHTQQDHSVHSASCPVHSEMTGTTRR